MKKSVGSLAFDKRDPNSVVVAASGYFEFMHKGHLEYLEKAKSLGDYLVVIVNNDEQALLKKGFFCMDISERIALIRSLRCVDKVFVSVDTDKTVCESLKAVKPNIFAKGGDRFAHEIPEKKICDELGIKIVDGLGDKIQSTRKILKRLKTHFDNTPEDILCKYLDGE